MRAKKETKRIMDFALQAVYKGTGKGKWGFGKGHNWNEKGGKGGKDGGKNPWQKGSGKKGGKGQEKGGKGETRTCWTCGKTGHIAAWCREGGKNMYAIDEDGSENAEESVENEEDLQAWCTLEESEHEQWKEVISRRSKHRMKKVNQASLLSVESSHSLSPKKIEVKDTWVKVRVTMDSGAAGQLMPETMFPHVKLERKTSPKKFVAANREQIKDLGGKSVPFTTNGVQRCITFRSANAVKPINFNAKGRPSWKHCGAGRKESAHSKHSRRNNHQAGREQCCVHNGHVDLPRRDRSSFQLTGQ